MPEIASSRIPPDLLQGLEELEGDSTEWLALKLFDYWREVLVTGDRPIANVDPGARAFNSLVSVWIDMRSQMMERMTGKPLTASALAHETILSLQLLFGWCIRWQVCVHQGNVANHVHEMFHRYLRKVHDPRQPTPPPDEEMTPVRAHHVLSELVRRLEDLSQSAATPEIACPERKADVAILSVLLKSKGFPLTHEDIAGQIKMSIRTVDKRIPLMRKRGLTRTNGGKAPEEITSLGELIAEQHRKSQTPHTRI